MRNRLRNRLQGSGILVGHVQETVGDQYLHATEDKYNRLAQNDGRGVRGGL